MAAARTPTPPVIGRAGSYTVFITPPTTPTPSEGSRSPIENPTPSLGASTPEKEAPLPAQAPPPSPWTPTPSESPRSHTANPSPRLSTNSPGKVAPSLATAPRPSPSPAAAPLPPVQVPPQQFEKPAAKSSGSVFGFFWDAVTKVQDAHSSLDEYLADWFGLNQSKYQWALNDYYESSGKKGSGKVSKPKEIVDKGQAV